MDQMGQNLHKNQRRPDLKSMAFKRSTVLFYLIYVVLDFCIIGYQATTNNRKEHATGVFFHLLMGYFRLGYCKLRQSFL